MVARDRTAHYSGKLAAAAIGFRLGSCRTRPVELLKTIISGSSAHAYAEAMTRSPTDTIKFLTLEVLHRVLARPHWGPGD